MSDLVHSTIKAHCPNCGGERNAYVRGQHVVNSSDEEDGTSSEDIARILECCGCGRVFFRRDFWFSEWETIGQHPITGETRLEGGTETTYWPAPVARKSPKWMDKLEEDRTLTKLLSEMYSALNSDLRVLAAIGARTVFDCSSEDLGIDPGLTFDKKLAELQAQGKISVDERDTLRVLVDAGVWGGRIAMEDPDNDQMKARGLAMFDMACMKGKGHVESCRYLAGIADDGAKRGKYYERACNLQDMQSCLELAKLMGAASDDKSKRATIALYKKLIGILEPRCDKKEVYACTSLTEVHEQMAIWYRHRACQADTDQPCEQ